jgi:hypothetical protein
MADNQMTECLADAIGGVGGGPGARPLPGHAHFVCAASVDRDEATMRSFHASPSRSKT